MRLSRPSIPDSTADAELFELAAHFADLHSGHTSPRHRRTLPGMERSVQIGGTGTPSVAEFALAEFGARIRMGTVGTRSTSPTRSTYATASR
jgi:hypothetical protein